MPINELPRKDGITALLEKCRCIQWGCSVGIYIEIKRSEGKSHANKSLGAVKRYSRYNPVGSTVIYAIKCTQATV